ncbi:amidase signature domain-containing protein [Diplogelasinospora grovesii]|uniref:Amidase signature domain-containing protein n=1 Tax=Diplogelasinospora grovesii TaxID=303347 RepID=A0AAN6N2Z9_9PEZI|nr:amidase signature domain-containing protein [Diplogelasinospora grovesii]
MTGTNEIDVLTMDAKHLQMLLESGKVTSVDLVQQYIDQACRHNEKFAALTQEDICSRASEQLKERAEVLDAERAAGRIRGPLHGIPIIIKDNIDTNERRHGLDNTAGSYANGWPISCPKEDAEIVDRLLDAGLIILEKANLSEWDNMRKEASVSDKRTEDQTCRAAGRHGEGRQSAYVRGGLDPDDSKDGHSNPSGSSSGSAVGVSIGFAPFSIGTETVQGSLVCPAGRAALYAIRPTIGLVPQEGIIPISHHFDTAGPMTKTVWDLAALLDVLALKPPTESFTRHLTGSWSDLRVAVLDPTKWRFPEEWVKPVKGAEAQMVREIRQAYDVIKSKAKRFMNNVHLISVDELKLDGESSEEVIILADLKRNLNECFKLRCHGKNSLEDVIKYNAEHKYHKDLELPPHHPRQDIFIKAQNQQTTQEEYDRHLRHLRYTARDRGVEAVLKDRGVDVILGPIDSGLTSIAAAGGFPLCAMPLGYLDYNGRPFGVAATAGRNNDATLVQVMSAWEATFPKRKVPPQLENTEGTYGWTVSGAHGEETLKFVERPEPEMKDDDDDA